MTLDPKTESRKEDAVDAATRDDSEHRELTMEELAIVTGGNGDEDSGWFESPGPDWNN